MRHLLFLLLYSLPVLGSAQNICVMSTHGGTLSDQFLNVIPTLDSGYAAVGVTSSFSSSADIYLVKFSKTNAVEWSRALGGAGIDWGYDLHETPDSGFVIAGFTSSYGSGGFDGTLVRTDKLGFNVVFTTFGGSDWDFFYDMYPTTDSGFIVSGKTYSGTNGYSDAWIVKTDKNLVEQWSSLNGGNLDETANCVIQTYDSNYVFCGTTTSNSEGLEDVWVVKLNEVGDTIFTYSFGDTLSDIGFTVLEHSIDSGLVIGGKSHSYNNPPAAGEALRLKINKNGQYMWHHVEGGPGVDDIIFDYTQFPDGKLIACGQTAFGSGQGDVLNYITDVAGYWMPYSPTYGGVNNDYGKAITFSLKGKYIIAGATESFGAGLSDGMILIADSVSSNYTPVTNSSSDTLVGIFSLSANDGHTWILYPNPATENVYLQPTPARPLPYHICDLRGRIIQSGNTTSNISVQALASGTYIVVLENEGSYARLPLIIFR